MVKKPADASEKGVPPSGFPETKPPLTLEMPIQTAQMIFEMNGTLGRIEEKLASLDKRVDTVRSDLKDDLNGIDDRFRTIEKHWHWIAGGIGVAVVLIPTSVWLLWISLQDKIEAIIQLVTKP